MKIAKSYKIIFFIVAFVLSIAFAFGFMKSTVTYADSTAPAVSSYFTGSVSRMQFNDKGLVLSDVKKDDSLSIKSSLILNALTFELQIPTTLTTVITFSADSFYVNGNPKIEGNKTTYQTSITNQIKLTANGSVVECTVNGGDSFEIDATNGLVLNLAVTDNYLTVNGKGEPTEQKDLDYYKLKNIDNKTIAKSIKFTFEEIQDLPALTNEQLVIVSVDQNRGEDGYKQSLKLSDVSDKEKIAKPRASLNDSFYTKVKEGNGFTYKAFKVAMGDYETVTFKAYAVIGDVSDLVLVNIDDNVELQNNTEKPKTICFDKAGTGIKFGIGRDGVAYEEFTVEVKPHGYIQPEGDEFAPKFIDDQIALDSFINALNKDVTVENADGTIVSVHLGKQLEIPSFEDLVYDDFVSYANLKKTVYYFTSETNGNSSTMKISLDTTGKYMFFVTFSDGVNAMEESDYYEQKGDDSIEFNAKLEKYVFSFEMKDNATIKVEKAKAQAKGYKGIKHKASRFSIDASGCKITYVLYYNSNPKAQADDNNWVEIAKAKNLKKDAYESKYNGNLFSYDEVKQINYDGELTFVPTRTGAYKIVCTATSDLSNRTSSDFTIFEVVEPGTVTAPSEWLQNNVWSVVFLSIGTLCLAGIIVLLCIKPKESTDND